MKGKLHPVRKKRAERRESEIQGTPSTRNVTGISASDKGDYYHLLSRSLRQSVAIAQIVDLNIFDVVSICDIDFGVQFRGALGGGRLGILCRVVGLSDNVRSWL